MGCAPSVSCINTRLFNYATIPPTRARPKEVTRAIHIRITRNTTTSFYGIFRIHLLMYLLFVKWFYGSSSRKRGVRWTINQGLRFNVLTSFTHVDLYCHIDFVSEIDSLFFTTTYVRVCVCSCVCLCVFIRVSACKSVREQAAHPRARSFPPPHRPPKALVLWQSCGRMAAQPAPPYPAPPLDTHPRLTHAHAHTRESWKHKIIPANVRRPHQPVIEWNGGCQSPEDFPEK